MTEAEWLTATDPTAISAFVFGEPVYEKGASEGGTPSTASATRRAG
jgi:hypothetical protein